MQSPRCLTECFSTKKETPAITAGASQPSPEDPCQAAILAVSLFSFGLPRNPLRQVSYAIRVICRPSSVLVIPVCYAIRCTPDSRHCTQRVGVFLSLFHAFMSVKTDTTFPASKKLQHWPLKHLPRNTAPHPNKGRAIARAMWRDYPPSG